MCTEVTDSSGQTDSCSSSDWLSCRVKSFSSLSPTSSGRCLLTLAASVEVLDATPKLKTALFLGSVLWVTSSLDWRERELEDLVASLVGGLYLKVDEATLA
jgi:hypothetical protein